MRKRWVYPRGGEPYEVGADYVQPVDKTSTDAVLYNDRLYQDDGDARYNSRKQHREYMKRNDLTTADDFKGAWQNAGKARERIAQGVDPERREQVARAVYQQLDGRRR